MLQTKPIRLTVAGFFLMVLIANCTHIRVEEPEPEPDYTMQFKWSKGQMVKNFRQTIIGLEWVLSELGAQLPNTGIQDGLLNIDEVKSTFTLDFTRVGFTNRALQKIHVVLDEIRKSNYYKEYNYVELGRFVMLTLNSTYHYYAITNVPETLNQFKSQYSFNSEMVMVVNSMVSKVNRRILISQANNYNEIAYLSEEGHFDSTTGNFVIDEFEVKELMPNGQFRFAIYDKNGQLMKGADTSKTQAGKSAKCLWCHETYIQPFFTPNPLFEKAPYISEDEFMDYHSLYTGIINEYRNNLPYKLYDSLHHHSYAEKIYLDFMEPAIEQVANEWNLSINEVDAIIGHLPVHNQVEYGIPNLYHRDEIDQLAPITSVRIPESPRETSDFEPHYFK